MIKESTNELIRNIGKIRYQGSSISQGTLYHDLPFENYKNIRSHRKCTADRWNYIKANSGIKFVNESVIDLGSSVGGISILAAKEGAWANGYDYDKESIELAKAISEEMGLKPRARFNHVLIDLNFIKNKMPMPHILIWMSQWMWAVKQYGLETAKEMLYEASKKANVMIFESAADDAMAAIKGATQADIGEWVKSETCYSSVKDIGFVPGWNNRHIFVCKGAEAGWKGYTATIKRLDRRTVEKTFRTGFEWMAAREAKFLKALEPYDISPKLISHDNKSIKMSYCGKKRPLEDCHRPWALNVLAILKELKFSHRDINPNNIMIYNRKPYLLDYGWSLFDGEADTPKAPPSDTLGGKYYKGHRGNDDMGMQRTLEEFGI